MAIDGGCEGQLHLSRGKGSLERGPGAEHSVSEAGEGGPGEAVRLRLRNRPKVAAAPGAFGLRALV